MDMMTTQSYSDFNKTSWQSNCNKNRSLSIENTITIFPFWSSETTTSDTLSIATDNVKIEIMVATIVGMVILVTLYAAAYRKCCSGKTEYHDSPTKAVLHVVITLVTYVLYLFDTLSDVFLLVHYSMIGQLSKFYLIVVFTFAPVVFLAFIFFSKQLQNPKINVKYHELSMFMKYCFTLHGMILVCMLSPFAALLPTYTYAQVLACGKATFKLEYFTSYLALVEATLESAPQLTAQIYLAITDTHTDTTNTRIIRFLSIAASSLGLAWSLNAFKHQDRKTKQNQEDRLTIKLIHWISRFAEIFPRILLIALVAAEYYLVTFYFILYRLLFGVIYGTCERWAVHESFRFLEEPDLLLGMIGNIFCFCVSDIYKCHKKERCGGKFFVFYYILYYAENGLLLYLWYMDDHALNHLKEDGACSNHKWYAPYVFVVAILGFIFQLSFLYLYYFLRKRQVQAKNTSETTLHNDKTETSVGSQNRERKPQLDSVFHTHVN